MVTLLDMFKEDGFEFRRVAATRGGEYAGPCFACGGSDRLRCWPFNGDRGGWYWCRREQKGGDAISYLREYRKLSFKEACALLGLDCGGYMARHARRFVNVRQTGKEEVKAVSINLPGDIWQKRALGCIERTKKQLAGNSEAVRFLNGRGLNRETIQAARLGWNASDEYRPRTAWGLEDGQTDGRPGKVWFPAGLVIPCFAGDKVARLRVRRAAGDPRYVIVPGSSRASFLSGTGRHAVVVVESELDALLLAQEAGDLVTVAAVGSVTGRPDIFLHGMLETVPLVLIALDNDEAGAAAVAWWLKHYRNAERWPVPEGKDQTEAMLRGVNLRSWIKAGVPVCAMIDRMKPKKKPEQIRPAASLPFPFTCLGCRDEKQGLCGRFENKPECRDAIKYC